MDSYYSTPMNEVNVLAKLADMKEEHYHQLVTLSAIMELLIEKGILTREEIEKKALEIDGFMTPPPLSHRLISKPDRLLSTHQTLPSIDRRRGFIFTALPLRR